MEAGRSLMGGQTETEAEVQVKAACRKKMLKCCAVIWPPDGLLKSILSPLFPSASFFSCSIIANLLCFFLHSFSSNFFHHLLLFFYYPLLFVVAALCSSISIRLAFVLLNIYFVLFRFSKAIYLSYLFYLCLLRLCCSEYFFLLLALLAVCLLFIAHVHFVYFEILQQH